MFEPPSVLDFHSRLMVSNLGTPGATVCLRMKKQKQSKYEETKPGRRTVTGITGRVIRDEGCLSEKMNPLFDVVSLLSRLA